MSQATPLISAVKRPASTCHVRMTPRPTGPLNVPPNARKATAPNLRLSNTPVARPPASAPTSCPPALLAQLPPEAVVRQLQPSDQLTPLPRVARRDLRRQVSSIPGMCFVAAANQTAATGASASASATGSSGNGADALHVGKVGLGFLGLVIAGLAL